MSLIVRKLLVRAVAPILLLAALMTMASPAWAAQAGQPESREASASSAPAHGGGEMDLKLPDLSSVQFRGVDGRTLLTSGLLIAVLGLVFGLVVFNQLKNLPVHPSMREVSELIYETCKTYLTTQGKFILILWVFIGAVAAVYFGRLATTVDASGAVVHGYPVSTVAIILIFSLIGIAGSYGVAWFGIRVNTFANSRAAFASLRGKPFPIY